MATYYFHLHENGEITADEHGFEFPDDESARRHAVAGARSIMAEELLTGTVCLSCHIDMENADTGAWTTIAFRDVISVIS
jgi:hypothetical protein